jgi:light-regulated signal transduction histidine kinase (bacteriophytochrome)
MTTPDFNLGNFVSSQQVDLTNCDREAIHIPGYIQPHGLLFVLKEPDLTIIQLSNNTSQFLGQAPEDLLNQKLDRLFESSEIGYLKKGLARENLEGNPLHLFTIKLKDHAQLFDGIAHRFDGLLILELEPSETKEERPHNYFGLVKQALAKLQPSLTFQEFCEVIVEQIQHITGFDRVLVYRFSEEDGSGSVVAESKQTELEPYLGLHYPASDIPKQARALYLLNWIRIIAEVNYQPTQIIPTINPLTNRSLDLSYSVLRSVSPIHLEYLKNMGVRASMSISLIEGDRLWGLIACHHRAAKYIPYDIRSTCEFLGQIISFQLSTKEDNQDSEYKARLKATHAQLLEFMSKEERFVDGLIKYEPNLLNFVEAQGAAVCFEEECFLLGQTPNEAQVWQLVQWLTTSAETEMGKAIFYTNALPELYHPAQDFKEVASGLLVIAISAVHNSYVLWFRPEVLQTVQWAGNPEKPIEMGDDGLRITPRKSFETWKQMVELKSLPWKAVEIEAVLELRTALINIVLQHALELAQLNTELERSNTELDAFAYIASHDLKEPLRGIHNYSNYLIRGYADKLDEDARSKLYTLIRLTQRMEDLIESLLHFSRVGRIDLSFQPTDLNGVVKRILELLSVRLEQTGVQIKIPRPLPTIKCDKVRVGEVFSNLITNAIKYSDKTDKWVEIGFQEPSSQDAIRGKPLIFYVKDNGIGIREKHFEAIFQIFKRLHARDEYGGGTGAGLTIVKKIVERHEGKIWLESTYGEGTTFFFTLQGGGAA